MKKQVTWILVTDGGRAKVFLSAGEGRLEMLHEAAIDHPASRDIVSDRPGRTFDSAGTGRHAMEPPSDPHDRAESEFIRSVASHVETACGNNEFDNLVVVAAPRALGDLRAACSKRLKAAISEEIAKDVTNMSTPELQKFMRQQEVI